MENINRERERVNGGQIQVPDAPGCSRRDLNLPSISMLLNFALNASSSVI